MKYFTIPCPASTLPKPHYPSPCTMSLPPLSKVRCCRPKKIRATTGGIALHPPTSQSPQPSQKHNTLSPRTNTLASLVKGRWIDGTTQTFALLLSVCDTPAFSISQTFCRQDGGIASSPSLACTNPPNPALSLAPHHVLASPRKRGGGTAVEVFRLAVQYSDGPAFTILKLFRAVTVGIARSDGYGKTYSCIPSRDGGDCSPSAPSMRFSALSPALNLPPLSKVRCCRPKKFWRLPEGLPHHHPSLAPTFPKPHYPTRFS